MEASDAKVAVHSAKSLTGVYAALEKAGVDTGRKLIESRKMYNNPQQRDLYWLVNTAIQRIKEIEEQG
jgi:hypothetical protein